jgi:hypothetical protein
MIEFPVGFDCSCADPIKGKQIRMSRILVTDLQDGIWLIRSGGHSQAFDFFAGLYLHAFKFLIVILEIVFVDG